MPAKWLFTVLLCISSSLLLAAESNVCPRPTVGSTVVEPVDLHSSNGVLKVELGYHRSVDEQGRPRFCFLTKDGNLAPNLRLRPGDELILTLKNDLPAPALSKLLWRSTGHLRRWCHHLSACVLDRPRRHRLKAHRIAIRERTDAGMAQDEEPGF